MAKWIEKLILFFSRDVGESSVEKDHRQTFLLHSHILQTTKHPRSSYTRE